MIRINLGVMMAKRRISLYELSGLIAITPANLSTLKTKEAIRFSTLNALCEAQDCQP